LSAGVAYAIAGFHLSLLDSVLYPLALGAALVTVPQLATFLLGMFTRRATADGAFAGLVAGLATALLLHGLTLPIDAERGWHGGWIAVVQRTPGFIAQCVCVAMAGFAVNALVALAVSVRTQAKTEKELKGLIYALKTKPRKVVTGWKRPEAIAVLVVVLTVVLAFCSI
jgi:SSS family solute:Na+ symporter